MKLLEVKNLNLKFFTKQGVVHALRSISFSLEHGKSVGLIGESGCGKSTVAHALLRLLNPSHSQIECEAMLFEGEELLSLSESEMQKKRGKAISLIMQDPMTSLNPTLTLATQLAEGVIYHLGYSHKQARAHALDLLHLVGISDPEVRLHQYPHALSGGMRQRVAIAIALACNPKLLIADEPTTALDVTIQAQILDLLQKIQQQMGTGLLFITHNLGVVAQMCDEALVMYAGEIVERASVETLFYSPKHPYTQGLLRSIPRLDLDKTTPLVGIPGSPPPNLHILPTGCPFAPRCSHAQAKCLQKSPPHLHISSTQEVKCWK